MGGIVIGRGIGAGEGCRTAINLAYFSSRSCTQNFPINRKTYKNIDFFSFGGRGNGEMQIGGDV